MTYDFVAEVENGNNEYSPISREELCASGNLVSVNGEAEAENNGYYEEEQKKATSPGGGILGMLLPNW